MLDIYAKGTDNIKDVASFFNKKPITCVVCGQDIFKEEVRTGRGRLDAGKLEADLQRQYIPTEEHGTVLPILYNIVTCNHCYFSYLVSDDPSKIKSKSLASLKQEGAIDKRLALLTSIVNRVPNFTEKRTMIASLSAYILAIASYDQYFKADSPSLRLAIVLLRSAWICKLLYQHGYGDETQDLMKIFYRKAAYMYFMSMEYHDKGQEDYREMKTFGPDSDKDFGFDGMVYVSSWLQFYYGDKSNLIEREKNLQRIRSTLSKVFGFGKSSKEKPSALLYQAKETFLLVEDELKDLQR